MKTKDYAIIGGVGIGALYLLSKTNLAGGLGKALGDVLSNALGGLGSIAGGAVGGVAGGAVTGAGKAFFSLGESEVSTIGDWFLGGNKGTQVANDAASAISTYGVAKSIWAILPSGGADYAFDLVTGGAGGSYQQNQAEMYLDAPNNIGLSSVLALEKKGLDATVALQVYRKQSGLSYDPSLIPSGY